MVQTVVLGEDILTRREYIFLFCLNKLNKQVSLFSWLNKLNKQTDLKGQHCFILFYFVHMWRTLPPFLASNRVLGPYFPSRTSCLFNYGKPLFFWICIITSLVNIQILSMNFFSTATLCPFNVWHFYYFYFYFICVNSGNLLGNVLLSWIMSNQTELICPPQHRSCFLRISIIITGGQ